MTLYLSDCDCVLIVIFSYGNINYSVHVVILQFPPVVRHRESFVHIQEDFPLPLLCLPPSTRLLLSPLLLVRLQTETS